MKVTRRRPNYNKFEMTSRDIDGYCNLPPDRRPRLNDANKANLKGRQAARILYGEYIKVTDKDTAKLATYDALLKFKKGVPRYIQKYEINFNLGVSAYIQEK
jgi:hypothetical protein